MNSDVGRTALLPSPEGKAQATRGVEVHRVDLARRRVHRAIEYLVAIPLAQVILHQQCPTSY